MGPSFELLAIATSAGLTGTSTVHSVTVNIPLSAGISGPTLRQPGASGTWQANPTWGAGTYTYQWQYRAGSSTTWTNVGTGTATYTRNAPFTSFYLRVTVTSGGVSATSPEFQVFVIQNDPGGDCQTDPNTGQTICT